MRPENTGQRWFWCETANVQMETNNLKEYVLGMSRKHADHSLGMHLHWRHLRVEWKSWFWSVGTRWGAECQWKSWQWPVEINKVLYSNSFRWISENLVYLYFGILFVYCHLSRCSGCLHLNCLVYPLYVCFHALFWLYDKQFLWLETDSFGFFVQFYLNFSSPLTTTS